MNARIPLRTAAWAACGVLAGCGDGAPPSSASTASAPAARFTDATAEAGIAFRHVSGAGPKYLLPEVMGGGAAWLDYDGDGRLDAFLVDSGAMAASGGAARAPGHRLFRNRGDGRFDDVTAAAFSAPFDGYGMGAAVADYDGDGDADLYLTNLGPNRLYRNDGGRFVDATAESGTGDPGWSTTAVFFDADGDADLDLFVGNYVAWRETPAFLEKACRGFGGARDYCSPQSYAARSYASFFRNLGGGRFRDDSDAAGFRTKPGTALGALAVDFDGDGRRDLYVANDQMPSFAWLNRGESGFVEDGVRLGVAVDELGKSQAGMGLDAADVDGDLRFDLWKVHLDRESHVLYLNRGDYFEDRTAAFGLAAPTRPRTGFGTAFMDADCDGLLDLFVANGRVEAATSPEDPSDPYAERGQFLRQIAPGRFVDATADAGPALAAVRSSRGAAFGDYDDDGDLDVLVCDRDRPARLLRNDSPRRGAWFGVRVVDARGADLPDARVEIALPGGRRFVDETRTAYSYAAANDPRVLFGLGAATEVAEVVVTAPGGARRVAGPHPVGRYVVVRF